MLEDRQFPEEYTRNLFNVPRRLQTLISTANTRRFL